MYRSFIGFNSIIIVFITSCDNNTNPELSRHEKTYVDTYYHVQDHWWIQQDHNKNPEDQLHSQHIPIRSKPAWK